VSDLLTASVQHVKHQAMSAQQERVIIISN